MVFELLSATEICEELCARLRAQRLAQNLQQAELATRAGVSVGTIRNLEQKGQITLALLVNVAIALGVVGDMNELFQPKLISIKALEAFTQSRKRASKPRKG